MGWRDMMKRGSGVCLAIGILGCGGKTEFEGTPVVETSSDGGGAGGTSATTNANGGSGGSGNDVTSTSNGAPDTPLGVPIPFTDGWAPLADNEVGVQGAFWTASDADDGAGTSSIAPQSFADGGTKICALGSAGQVLPGADGMPDYVAHWGTLIGFNLSQEEGTDYALPYDATAHDVVGFSFVIGGSNPLPPGGELRFNLKVKGDDNNYCRKIPTTGMITFRITDLWQSCWQNDATLPTPDATQLESLHWQYVTNTTASYEFDICITDLRAIVAR